MERSLTNISRTFTKAVDSLPLAGKFAQKDLLDSFFSAKTEGEARFKFRALNALLGIYDLAHLGQAAIGVAELPKDAHRFKSDPTFLRFAETAMDGAYVLINLAVVTANTLLLARIWQHALNRGFLPRESALTRQTLGKQHGTMAMIAALAITVGGNAGYISTTFVFGDHSNNTVPARALGAE